MRSRSKLQQLKRKGIKSPRPIAKTSIWDRVEPEKDFMERKIQGVQTRAAIGRISRSAQMTSMERESESVRENPNDNENTKTEVVLVDLADDSSEEEDERKYPPTLIDILEHFDYDTGEQALDLQIKDVTTISVKKARELRKEFPNLQGENNVLDSIIHPRADVSSLSSHSAAARRLMRSMPNIDDKILRNLIGRASDAHTEIVKHLSEHKSQISNVDMITPPGSPRPSTSSKSYCPRNERRPVRRTGNESGTNKTAIVPPQATRETIIVTSEEDQSESSDDGLYINPRRDDRGISNQMPNEQGVEDGADEVDQNTDDSDENVLFLSSPSEDNWGNDEA